MMQVHATRDEVHFGPAVTVRFMRTLRIPDDGREYPLPPGLGEFPIYRVEDYADRVPADWREHGGVFIPMYQREAMWLDFSARWWKPNAVKVGVGKINAISGEAWTDTLSSNPQDYVVCPDQPWLDGVNAGNGFIRQFVAMPLGEGYTVEGQLTGKEEFGGLQLMVFEPKPGRFPDEPPYRHRMHLEDSMRCCCYSPPDEMGLAAGGRMRQKLYPDPHGIDVWDLATYGRLYVHIVDSRSFRRITGSEPPPTPVTAREYAEAGLPWFDLLDEKDPDLPPAEKLQGVKSVATMDQEKGGASLQDDGTLNIHPQQIAKLKAICSKTVSDGKW